jgi:acetyl-CoA synthetase
MPSEQNVYEPDSKLSRQAYVSSMSQYEELYKQSIEEPGQFWGNIAKQFHWETAANPDKFLDYNFDISKGSIYLRWMEGASTNICYNLLDRNIKNGHGDKIAFYWYVSL